jgi:hypothetical protein
MTSPGSKGIAKGSIPGAAVRGEVSEGRGGTLDCLSNALAIAYSRLSTWGLQEGSIVSLNYALHEIPWESPTLSTGILEIQATYCAHVAAGLWCDKQRRNRKLHINTCVTSLHARPTFFARRATFVAQVCDALGRVRGCQLASAPARRLDRLCR